MLASRQSLEDFAYIFIVGKEFLERFPEKSSLRTPHTSCKFSIRKSSSITNLPSRIHLWILSNIHRRFLQEFLNKYYQIFISKFSYKRFLVNFQFVELFQSFIHSVFLFCWETPSQKLLCAFILGIHTRFFFQELLQGIYKNFFKNFSTNCSMDYSFENIYAFHFCFFFFGFFGNY